jgi:hypothetical protein
MHDVECFKGLLENFTTELGTPVTDKVTWKTVTEDHLVEQDFCC